MERDGKTDLFFGLGNVLNCNYGEITSYFAS